MRAQESVPLVGNNNEFGIGGPKNRGDFVEDLEPQNLQHQHSWLAGKLGFFLTFGLAIAATALFAVGQSLRLFHFEFDVNTAGTPMVGHLFRHNLWQVRFPLVWFTVGMMFTSSAAPTKEIPHVDRHSLLYF